MIRRARCTHPTTTRPTTTHPTTTRPTTTRIPTLARGNVSPTSHKAHFSLHLTPPPVSPPLSHLTPLPSHPLQQDDKISLDGSRIKSFLTGALRGLSFCHKNWVLHRDLKPGNLLIGANGQIKLADFGLARSFGSPGRKFTGQVVTRWYRAPELLFGAKFYGAAVDLWSIGCIFAEMLMRAPFLPGTSDIDQLSRIFTALGTPNSTVWPGIDALPDYVAFNGSATPATPLSDHFRAASPAAIALLSRLLTFCPSRRPTAEEALASTYFSEAPLPASEDELLAMVQKKRSGTDHADALSVAQSARSNDEGKRGGGRGVKRELGQ